MKPLIWYMPTWNGDLRVQAVNKHPEQTELILHKPTAQERVVADCIGAVCLERGWIKQWVAVAARGFWRTKLRVVIDAPMDEVGPVVSKLLRPNEATLTAIQLSNGRVETTSGSLADLQTLATETLGPAYREKPEPEKPDALAPPEATAAATVKRATPSCPDCMPGAIEPATEALLAFLSPAEHASWAATRTIEVTGQLSGHRYLLAHRHTPTARRMKRICYDLDDEKILHFHDWTVPPEEEVLAAKLILEHREPWLRNEATLFGGASLRYKNPFGNWLDGTESADMMNKVGELFGYGIGSDGQLVNLRAQRAEDARKLAERIAGVHRLRVWQNGQLVDSAP